MQNDLFTDDPNKSAMNADERNNIILRYSIVGIVINLFLALAKVAVGFIVNAHMIMLDGVNSLSDSIALFISLVSNVIGRKRGSKAHPFGYGRIEYVSSIIITMIITYIGISSIVETVKSIIDPHEAPAYTTLSVAIMVFSLIFKLIYGVLMRKNGKKLDSIAMIMIGADSMGDALISIAILFGIVFYKIAGIDIEHYLCIAIALMIIKSGVEMFMECINKVLGSRADPETKHRIINMVMDINDVLYVSNLVLHNYGEGVYVGSLDVEVEESLTAQQITRLSRTIIKKAYDLGVTITSVGISCTNIHDKKSADMYDQIIDIARKYSGISKVQSFTLDKEENTISFYVVPDYSFKTYRRDIEDMESQIRDKWPDMQLDIHVTAEL